MAFNTRKIGSASIHGTALLGVTGVTIDAGGSSFDIVGDGQDNIEDTFVDGIAVDVVVSVADIDLIKGFAVGDGGTLIFVTEERVGSDGAAAGADTTLTIPAASLQSFNYDVPTSGAGAGSLTFRCAGPAGAAIYTWS